MSRRDSKTQSSTRSQVSSRRTQTGSSRTRSDSSRTQMGSSRTRTSSRRSQETYVNTRTTPSVLQGGLPRSQGKGNSRSRQDRQSSHASYRDASSYQGSSRSFRETGVSDSDSYRMSSTSVGEIRRSERYERAQERARSYALRVIAVLVVLIVLVLACGIAYNSELFVVTNVEIEGVEHLTESEMAQMAAVPENTTLLRVDTETIKNRLLQNAWVSDVSIERHFPDTLVIKVTERQITAVVSIPQSNGKTTKRWAIASDHMWLMPIPDQNSESGKNTSEKIYEDADAALKITNVPYGTQATIGTYCTDSNVLNALDIVSGMTTELASQVVEVSASGADETTLMLENGVEIAFGKAENIRDKERVVLEILKEYEGDVSYINVRTVSSPTWRTV